MSYDFLSPFPLLLCSPPISFSALQHNLTRPCRSRALIVAPEATDQADDTGQVFSAVAVRVRSSHPGVQCARVFIGGVHWERQDHDQQQQVSVPRPRHLGDTDRLTPLPQLATMHLPTNTPAMQMNAIRHSTNHVQPEQVESR